MRLTAQEAAQEATHRENRYVHLLMVDKEIFSHRGIVMLP